MPRETYESDRLTVLMKPTRMDGKAVLSVFSHMHNSTEKCCGASSHNNNLFLIRKGTLMWLPVASAQHYVQVDGLESCCVVVVEVDDRAHGSTC